MSWDIFWDFVQKGLNLLGGLSGIALLILGVAKLLGKNLLDYWFAKDIERYKSELDVKNKDVQNQLDIKLELVKLHESQLIEIRVDSIKKIYQILANLQGNVDVLNMPIRPTAWGEDQDIANEVQKLFIDFQREWLPCKLFFNKELSDKIELFANKCYSNADQNMFNKNVIKQDYKLLKEELNKLREEAKELPPILQEIECNFRDLVGINSK
ncbi:hypothetical protein [Bacteroides sp.]|uniref:hypothetical protein n=1 Tax=Bacteroides sp. TaxID=29523 RepID=UPI002A82C755|nr:hypothetical protein [Bacteroides sp.]